MVETKQKEEIRKGEGERKGQRERGKETGFPTNPASSTMFYALIYQCSPHS